MAILAHEWAIFSPWPSNNKRGKPSIDDLPHSTVARAAGFEPTTYGLEVRLSGLPNVDRLTLYRILMPKSGFALRHAMPRADP